MSTLGQYRATPETLLDGEQRYPRLDSTGAIVIGAPAAGVPMTPAKAATATHSDVTAAAATTPILAANTNRLPGSTITNDSTAIMYVLLGSGTVSATNYTVAIDGKTTVPGVYFLPDGWTGAVQGIWASATGTARVTELSA